MVSTGVWLIHVLATEKMENVALEMVDRKKEWQFTRLLFCCSEFLREEESENWLRVRMWEGSWGFEGRRCKSFRRGGK